ncbi:multidrug efflux pump subunit AcrB [Salinibacter ruber]|uniref:Multidrug resistance protein, putative n=1 Tax=Salinibacter ruber (strain DSM 13855 / M31) TaxID=309807 RepID=Q2S423_SALRD|nr:efflux RND transporter permease subunit [Salinibacter ruber]ABC43827.1 multidrug resistance protein, putative [Salinibacter ruber DSM 13855]MBB4061488.1 multidrug efflux pump subunit AcrB [Salinibacter ruber]MBB4067781.1 multidrug efflux pump subunit AcrB [Salinibacter ruber]MCS3637114.1 multidrug efflux pump subunit AcrB [Salinibacter ruber]MCS3641271.1 multidrug efflux pump subunit AcrB [Salinibacter ruber]
MKITNLSIKYRTAIAVFTLILAVGGLASYLTIPKESNPSIEFPQIVVTSVYPGASPSDVESTVSQVIEQEISSINGIDEMRSTSSEGVSTIVVEFTPDVNTDKAYQEVNRAVDRAQPDLPGAVEEPLVDEINTDQFPIMTVNLSGTYSLARLKTVAEDLQDDLEGISSVLEANLIGGLTREVQVNVDLAALKNYNVSYNSLVNTIQQENTNIPGGSIDVNRLNYLVRVDGQFDQPAQQIEELVVKTTANGRTVQVKDVADVIFGFKDRTSYSRLRVLKRERADGETVSVPASERRTAQVISLNVTKRPGANILETSDAVKSTLDAFSFPSGTEVLLTGDQSENVQSLVTDLENNIISGLIFVIAVLLFFLGVRNATLVGIAIPLSMFTSFLVFQALGYTLNFIILFSLIIALGMLVDNAVVVIENIYRFREQGYSRWESARLGTAEVGGPVVAATATTVSAFAPMLLWPGIIGEFMSYMPLTLIITLTSSLFVALIINPVITGFFVEVKGRSNGEKGSSRWPALARYGGVGLILLLGVTLGIANWKTLVVVATAVPALYLLHVYVMSPIGDRFVESGLPRLIRWYRGYLQRMLERDYSVPYAFLRNTGALTALAAGALLAAGGGLITTVAGQTAGLLLLVPGGVLAALGALGVLVHTLESIYLGGWTSVKGGVGLLAVMLAVLGLNYLAGGIGPGTMLRLAAAPVFVVGVGLIGALFNTRDRLLLTDTRAALLNGSLGGLVLIVGLYLVAPTGQAFFPDTDPNRVQITAEAPLGTNIEASNRIAQTVGDRILKLLDQNPNSEANIENLLVNVGVGGDAQFGGGAQQPERSRVSLNMVDYAERPESSTRTLEKMRAQLQGIPGTEIEFTKQEQGPPTGPPVNIELSGPEFERIVQISNEVKRRLTDAAQSGRLPGLVDVTDNLNTGRPEVQVDVDRAQAAEYGLSTSQIAQTVRTAIQGTEADTYRSGEDEYDITVRLQKQDRKSIESLGSLTVTNPRGQQIPLTSVADIEEGTGFGSITRIDQNRVVTVSGGAAPGYNGPEVLTRVQDELSEYRQGLPPGYTMEYTGGNEDQQESFGFLTTALLIGASLILLILIVEFNSISAPFIIMVAVGLSMIGVLLGLILTRTPFNLFTFIGIIALAGIVVNNNIVLVDYIMQLRGRGQDKQEAIVEGGATRLRPVLLTALTTILGLVPLTFGINVDFVGLLADFAPNFQFGSENTQFWGPMGTAIISGLTFATFLTLVIVPVMYSVFDSVSLRLTTAFGGSSDDASIVSETVVTDSLLDDGSPGDGAPAGDASTPQADRPSKT